MSKKYKRKGRPGRLSHDHKKQSTNISDTSKDLISLLKCSFANAQIANGCLEGHLSISVIDSDTKPFEPFLKGTIECSGSPVEFKKTKAVCEQCSGPCERYTTVVQVCVTAEKDDCSTCTGGAKVSQGHAARRTTGVNKRKLKSHEIKADKSQTLTSKSLFSKRGRRIKVKRLESFVGFSHDNGDPGENNIGHQKLDSEDFVEDVSDMDQGPICRKRSGGQTHKCEVCSKCFSLASALRVHMQVHSAVSSASRRKRTNLRKTKSDLQKPIQDDQKHESMKCKICEETFKEDTLYLKHIKCIHPNISVSDDKEHAINCGSSREAEDKEGLEAECIESSVDNQVSQQDGQQEARNSETEDQDKPEDDTSLNQVGDHETRIERPYQCDECGKTFATLPGLRSHKKNHSTLQFKCTMCDKAFKTQDTLDYHMELHTGNRKFVCDICNCRFTTKQKVDNHVRRMHFKEKLKQCEVCSKSFFENHELRQHKLIHTGEKPHPCGLCDRKFLTRPQLQKHMAVHGQAQSNFCKFCQVTFTVRRTYNKHMRTVHGTHKLHVCEFCGRSFQRNGQLEYHRLRHTGYDGFKCDVCEKTFRSQSYLRKHKALHTGENLITCDNCGKKFNDPWYFNKHKKHYCHSVKQNCQFCDRSYTLSKDLRQHMGFHTGERPYMCALCGKAFTRVETYNEHVKRHTQEKCHVCKICGKTFYRGSELRKHEPQHKKVSKRGNFSNSHVSFIPEKTMEEIERHETNLEDDTACSDKTAAQSEDSGRSETIEYLVMDETGLHLDPKVLHAILETTVTQAGSEKPVNTIVMDCGQDH